MRLWGCAVILAFAPLLGPGSALAQALPTIPITVASCRYEQNQVTTTLMNGSAKALMAWTVRTQFVDGSRTPVEITYSMDRYLVEARRRIGETAGPGAIQPGASEDVRYPARAPVGTVGCTAKVIVAVFSDTSVAGAADLARAVILAGRDEDAAVFNHFIPLLQAARAQNDDRAMLNGLTQAANAQPGPGVPMVAAYKVARNEIADLLKREPTTVRVRLDALIRRYATMRDMAMAHRRGPER